MADMLILILFGLFMFMMGIVTMYLIYEYRKRDGRLVCDDDDYFVAITTKPEELVKKKRITLTVIRR